MVNDFHQTKLKNRSHHNLNSYQYKIQSSDLTFSTLGKFVSRRHISSAENFTLSAKHRLNPNQVSRK